MKYKVKKGDVKASNMWKRHMGGVSGLCLVPNKVEWNMSINMSDCPIGTHMKLCGLIYLTPTFNRVKLGGWHELLNFSHENSDRVMVTKTGSGLKLRTYTYRDGYGPSTEMKPLLEFKDLGTVDENEQFNLTLYPNYHSFGLPNGKERITSTWNLIYLDPSNTQINTVENAPRKFSRFGHYTFVHVGGYKQPTAPCDININCKVKS